MRIKDRFIKTIIENSLIEPGDKVVVALSGGPDSVALFHLLNEIKDEYKLTLCFAHINHQLRGENSDGDEKFVIDLGKKYEIETFTKQIDIKKYSREKKIGEEEAGREVRYAFFEEVKTLTKANKVALAHNLDDNVETFLFRMMRGSSLEGLTSIPVQRDLFIRPLLDVYKKDILAYLNENGYEYRVDESNNENIYTRNKIRLDLIPYIENEFNSNFKNSIINLINEVKEISEIDSDKIKELSTKERIKLKEISGFSTYHKRKLINEKLKLFNLNINRKKIEEIISILKPEGTKEINLGKNYYFYKTYDEFYISERKNKDLDLDDEISMLVGESIIIHNYKITFCEVDLEKKKIKKDENCFYIDYNKVINRKFIVRTRRAGDSFIPLGLKHRKKLKDFFINEKIDKYSRNTLPIVLNDDKIVCVGNLRMSDEFKITDATNRLIKIELKEVDYRGK